MSTAWFVIAGTLLVLMALASTLVRRLPLSAPILYLAVGAALGPLGAGMIRLDPVEHAALLERLSEGAVIIALFTAGLKLRTPWRDDRWILPVRLAFISMSITVALIAWIGVAILGLPLGAAIVLGAILAPTDAVLASDVQVENPSDRDRLRFSITGEAGLNDGTAFPFVMLGLGLLGFHDLGDDLLRWVAVDVVWGVAGGLGIGALLGTLVGRTVVYLRRTHEQAVGLDDFLALGLLALSYGAALLAHTYGFLAVFAAGLALRRIERLETEEADVDILEHVAPGAAGATDQRTASAYMARAVLGFNERLERMAEVALVVIVGAMLPLRELPRDALWMAPLLLLVVRPIAVILVARGVRVSAVQRRLIAWFGVRGIGSLYYLAYAIEHGLAGGQARRLADLTLTVVAVSIVVHGVSVTPLLRSYTERRRAAP